ncbi:MAG: hypothetical protein J6X18_11725 [Bacteroidales bacterium]|nr:hypothetical protein [Bacteroidales bacterium]
MAELQITTIKYVDNTPAVLREETAKINNALSKMGDSIKNRAQLYAPYDSGDLHDDARVEKAELSVKVIFGGFAVPYARRRHYENNLHPETKYYLERAGNETTRQGVQFYL